MGRVIHVEDEPPALFSQLLLLGITPGAYVEVDEHTPGRVLVWSGRQRLALAPAAAERIFIVDAPPESLPLSEIEVGQAAQVAAFESAGVHTDAWQAQGLRPGVEVAAIRVDPLGDPVIYRFNGTRSPSRGPRPTRSAWPAPACTKSPCRGGPGGGKSRTVCGRCSSATAARAVAQRVLVFLGPAFVISVGYMDPGNWGTDIEGGARFGYQLLWVILMANLMAMLMQILSAKLGIATGKSLPEVCRDRYPRWMSVALWITAELAAIATDLAEFLGGAVGFNLLFGIPLFPAAILTGVVISLILLLERYGFRKVEMVIIGLIAVIGFVYMS